MIRDLKYKMPYAENEDTDQPGYLPWSWLLLATYRITELNSSKGQESLTIMWKVGTYIFVEK